MTVRTDTLEYSVGENRYAGYLAWDDAVDDPRPGVLVCHTWAGQGDFENSKCRALAKLGYVALAIDVYGKGVRGTGPAENEALLRPLLDDRDALLKRLRGSLSTLGSLPRVDNSSLAAIGFCFGGLCVLDMLRAGLDLKGVVSFHGLLGRPESWPEIPATAKALVLHGWDDPMATPDAVVALGEELSRIGADWQVHAYGGTVHAFTNPAASDAVKGTVYHAAADRRSWAAMTYFLDELFTIQATD